MDYFPWKKFAFLIARFWEKFNESSNGGHGLNNVSDKYTKFEQCLTFSLPWLIIFEVHKDFSPLHSDPQPIKRWQKIAPIMCLLSSFVPIAQCHFPPEFQGEIRIFQRALSRGEVTFQSTLGERVFERNLNFLILTWGSLIF